MHQEQYALLLKRIEETRRARHDLRQHLTLIQSYLDNGDKDALKEYVHAYGQSIPESVGIFIYCKNYAIDTIARFYLSQAEDEGIQVNVSLPLPQQLPIPEPDVCILLGNLLENALVHSGSRLPVELTVTCTDGEACFCARDYGVGIAPERLSTIFDGSCYSPESNSDGHRGMGIGLSICKTIITAHSGRIGARNHENGCEFFFTLPRGQ